MALIEINTDSVRQKASDVRNICESHVELVSKLESLVESMGDWKGEAQEAFVSKFQQMRPILNKFNESMQEFAASMDEGATGMEAADNEAASLFGSIA